MVDTNGYTGGDGNRRFRIYYWLNPTPGPNTIVVANPYNGDNELAVSRKGLDARVTLEPSRVRIDLNLGFLMTPFADVIKTGITKKLSSILAATS